MPQLSSEPDILAEYVPQTVEGKYSVYGMILYKDGTTDIPQSKVEFGAVLIAGRMQTAFLEEGSMKVVATSDEKGIFCATLDPQDFAMLEALQGSGAPDEGPSGIGLVEKMGPTAAGVPDVSKARFLVDDQGNRILFTKDEVKAKPLNIGRVHFEKRRPY